MAKKKAPDVTGEINVTNNIENAVFNNNSGNVEDGEKLEQIKQELIQRYKQAKFELPYKTRAAGCTSSRDYLVGHIEELRQILAKYFDYKED